MPRVVAVLVGLALVLGARHARADRSTIRDDHFWLSENWSVSGEPGVAIRTDKHVDVWPSLGAAVASTSREISR
jgi:hypothetical protein